MNIYGLMQYILELSPMRHHNFHSCQIGPRCSTTIKLYYSMKGYIRQSIRKNQLWISMEK